MIAKDYNKKDSNDPQAHGEAQMMVDNDNEDFTQICSLAGVKPEIIREIAKKNLIHKNFECVWGRRTRHGE